MPAHLRSGVARRLALSILAIGATATPSSTRAETHVTGVAEAVRLEANDATVDETLVALGAAFGLRYRASAALDRRITGTYEGPIEHVISRLLMGYNFIVKTSPGSTQVMVLGNSSAPPVKAPKAAAQNIDAPPSPLHARAPRFRD